MAFGGVGVKFAVTPLPNGGSPALTPTQGMLGDVFPKNSLTSAPDQDTWTLTYKPLTTSEAIRIFSRLRAGEARLVLGLNFGEEVLSYNVDAVVSDKIVDEFNACSSKTNIYGRPFTLPTR
jgi:hypothetical protein